MSSLVCAVSIHWKTMLLTVWIIYSIWIIRRLAGAATTEGCPRTCFCNPLSNIVYCSRRGLPTVPESLPEGTLQLNLNGNSFRSQSIHRSNLTNYGSLEHLYMSDCGIEAIGVDAFVDLVNLRWLDISDNRLSVLQENTFRGLRLQHLFLNGNRDLQLLPMSFAGLVTTGLYLHDCSISRLPVEVLAPLNGTLSNFWLNGNQLERVDQRLASFLATLAHVRLGSNPLRCNCEVVWLKEFFDKNGETFKGAEPPGCQAPARIKGKHFSELSLFDFRCQSPAFSNIDAFFDSSHGKLKCAATGDPTPSLYWIQPSGRAIKYDPPTTEDNNRNEGVLNLSGDGEAGSGMSGMYICVANNEAGNVTLTINVSWPHPGGVMRQPPVRHRDHTVDRTDVGVGGGGGIRLGSGDIDIFPGIGQPTSVGKKSSVTQPTTPSRSGSDGYALLDKSPADGVGGGGSSDPHQQQVVRDGVFSLTEMVLAVVGTHLITVALALLVLSVYHWTRSRQQQQRCRDRGVLLHQPQDPYPPPQHQKKPPPFDPTGSLAGNSDLYFNTGVRLPPNVPKR